jgi:GH24 family phage-related lysozyme (muramidase)
MTYAISPAGFALIQEFEGFCAEPRQMPDGNWAVGYGHVRVGEKGEAVNEAEAAALLTMDVAPAEALVNAAVDHPLTQNQFDALVSFAFSVGERAFETSQVLRRVNSGELVAAACAMDAWRKSDVSGELVIVDVLIRRRAAEKALFLKGLPCEAAPSVFMRAKLDYAASVLGAPVKYDAAPVVGSIPLAQAKHEPAARLVEIMKSEPATEAMLLTQVVDEPANDCGDEITTAYAKPVARIIDPVIPSLPLDRRIRDQKSKASAAAPLFKLPKFALPKLKMPRLKASHSFEVIGLVALFLFGASLVAVGGSMFFEGHTDGITIAGASAVTAPGLAAAFIAGAGLLHNA